MITLIINDWHHLENVNINDRKHSRRRSQIWRVSIDEQSTNWSIESQYYSHRSINYNNGAYPHHHDHYLSTYREAISVQVQTDNDDDDDRVSRLEHTIHDRDQLIDRLEAEIAEHCCDTTTTATLAAATVASNVNSSSKCVAHDRRKDRSVSEIESVMNDVRWCSKVSLLAPIEWQCVSEQQTSFNVSLIRWLSGVQIRRRQSLLKCLTIIQHRRRLRVAVAINHRRRRVISTDQNRPLYCRDCVIAVRQRHDHQLPNHQLLHRPGNSDQQSAYIDWFEESVESERCWTPNSVRRTTTKLTIATVIFTIQTTAEYTETCMEVLNCEFLQYYFDILCFVLIFVQRTRWYLSANRIICFVDECAHLIILLLLINVHRCIIAINKCNIIRLSNCSFRAISFYWCFSPTRTHYYRHRDRLFKSASLQPVQPTDSSTQVWPSRRAGTSSVWNDPSPLVLPSSCLFPFSAVPSTSLWHSRAPYYSVWTSKHCRCSTKLK